MPFVHPDSALMIFCKAPVSGRVKTRLVPPLTESQAAALHIELTVRTLKTATASPLCPVQLWCAPSTDHPFFTAVAKDFPVVLRQQQGHDLGARMDHAFRSALADCRSALIIGCDCPSLTEADFAAALDALDRDNANDVVLSPAEDGGYVLLGLKRPCPELFSHMPWGTSEVLDQTRSRIRSHPLRWLELKEQWDVDTIEDWHRYKNMPERL
ncbi:MAG: TIGR04282 family arsenosugar biosynthesis glycosyltransferase [Gammaproteobacteria bacterium]